jgi:hypothetical protein
MSFLIFCKGYTLQNAFSLLPYTSRIPCNLKVDSDSSLSIRMLNLLVASQSEYSLFVAAFFFFASCLACFAERVLWESGPGR